MSDDGPKDDLLRYLRVAREAVVWKLDGLGEYDVRRPLTATGTNLLGLVKHLAGVEAEYFGATFGRPFPEPVAWTQDAAEDNADMWATPDQTREQIVGLYRRVWAHADDTVAALDLSAIGHVRWWSAPHDRVTLHRMLVHVTTETNRHAGHADIVRELIDSAAGLRDSNSNLPSHDRTWWAAYVERVQAAAEQVRD